jgi:HEAT repeat protein
MSADIAALVTALNSADLAARQQAAEQLVQLGEEAQVAAVPLVEACGGEATLRDAAAAALESLGPPPDKDVEALARLLARPQLDVAYWAATLLGRLQDGAEPAVAALAEALNHHPELAVRERAAWALGKIGPAAAAAHEALQAAAASSQTRLAHLAKDALQTTQK